MNGFVISGRIVNIEKKVAANGNPRYKIAIEDSDANPKFPKTVEITVMGGLAKNFNSFVFKAGTPVLASGFLDAFRNSAGYINLSLVAMMIIPLNKNISQTEETVEQEEKVLEEDPSKNDTEVSEDDLPF